MKLGYLCCENIFSFKSLEVDLSDKDFCCITGENRDDNCSNGSGKSSLLMLPRLAIFDKISKRNVISDWAKKGSVHMVLGDALIERFFPGNKVKLNGNSISQEELEHFFGITDLIFCNSVYYGQNTLNLFASSTAAVQLKLFTDMIPDLQKLDRARELCNIERNEYKGKIVDLRSRIDEIGKVDRKEILHLIAKGKEMQGDILEDKKRADILRKNIESLNVKIKSYEVHKRMVDDYNRIKIRMEELRSVKQGKVTRKKEYEDKINTINALKSKSVGSMEAELEQMIKEQSILLHLCGNYTNAIQISTKECPLCFSKIDAKKQTEIIGPRLEEAKVKLNRINPKIQTKRFEIVKIKKAISEANSLKTDYDKVISSLESIQEDMERLQKEYIEKKKYVDMDVKIPHEVEKMLVTLNIDLVKLDNKITSKISEVSDLEAKIKIMKKNRMRRKELVELHEKSTYRYSLSDYAYRTFPIIKVRIIDSNVIMVESALNDFMVDLYPSHCVSISTTSTLKSEEIRDKLSFTVISERGTEKDWDDLSGGEQSRIALGTQIALRSIVRTPIMFEAYDEIFGSLGDGGLESVMNLLMKRRNEGKQIFAISHTKEVNSYFESNIHIIKESGVSSVKS
jgi:DNA repair exonuclease SbcCD ATPase subunit